MALASSTFSLLIDVEEYPELSASHACLAFHEHLYLRHIYFSDKQHRHCTLHINMCEFQQLAQLLPIKNVPKIYSSLVQTASGAANKQLEQGQDHWCTDITHNQLQSCQWFTSFMQLRGKSVETF
jgi:hypothetical protein